MGHASFNALSMRCDEHDDLRNFLLIEREMQMRTVMLSLRNEMFLLTYVPTSNQRGPEDRRWRRSIPLVSRPKESPHFSEITPRPFQDELQVGPRP